MTVHWFPDNSVIVNFAHVDRLDLLRGYLREQGRVVEAVAFEIDRSRAHVSTLSQLDQSEWFGEPIVIDDVVDMLAIEGIRKHRFGGTDGNPREHLGESQTLYVIQSRSDFAGSVWLTEDRDAYDFGKRQGISTKNTFEILADLVGFLEIDADTAFDLAVRLDELDRLHYCPSSANEFG